MVRKVLAIFVLGLSLIFATSCSNSSKMPSCIGTKELKLLGKLVKRKKVITIDQIFFNRAVKKFNINKKCINWFANVPISLDVDTLYSWFIKTITYGGQGCVKKAKEITKEDVKNVLDDTVTKTRFKFEAIALQKVDKVAKKVMCTAQLHVIYNGEDTKLEDVTYTAQKTEDGYLLVSLY